MRLQYSLLELCLCFLQLNAHLAVDARHAVLPRQDGPMPTQGPASVTATHPVFSENPIPDASRSAARPSKTPSEASNPAISSDTSLTSDGSALPTSSVAPSVLISSPLPSTISTAPDVASPPLSTDLPITPAITPALSVAGAILILTGPFYALVGIKNKWLQVFLSSAYLTSLAVTVLIVYVMHPPVSNAIQGAYLVAACMTGLIFGGGSLIFADITEALACLLGGFSLAMWFLVLVPGGLIRSTAGKAIFIGCFILGSFGFYTSRWTRAYGIIGSTAFAGATVIVLGIDCFSRAGLKEFWLYIWGEYTMNGARKTWIRCSKRLSVVSANHLTRSRSQRRHFSPSLQWTIPDYPRYSG